ncbi:MAG: hypothetical protein GWP10_13375 [Nitrospiraceae bacterium]|nr:hypothetical protein [Nitrospiraceae bacterium]
MKNVYFWYSGATDVTGKNLVEGLSEMLDSHLFSISGGTSEPSNIADIVICYGAKTSAPVTFGNRIKVLNHPNSIRINRNKLKALEVMKDHVNIAKFSKIDRNHSIVEDITYPAIARTNYHQGGKGLAICLSKKQIKNLSDLVKFGYIQELISFKQEYRIHVFKDKIVRCVAKIPQADPINSWLAAYKEKTEKIAQKRGITLNNETLETCLKAVVNDLTLPDLLVKSNKRGWCFKKVNISNVPSDLVNEAKAAVKALTLDFGAVDCAIDYNNKAYIIEVNTGPGLQGKTLELYLNEFKEYITNEGIPNNNMGQQVQAQESHQLQHVQVNRDDINNKIMSIASAIAEINARVEEISQQMNRSRTANS